jgi:hypothetical protein
LRIHVCCDEPGGLQAFDHAEVTMHDGGSLFIRKGDVGFTFAAGRWIWFDQQPDLPEKPAVEKRPERVDSRPVGYFGERVGPAFST